MSKTVSQKMGLKEGMRAFFQNAPASALRAMKLPELNASQTLRGEFDYLHLFTTSQAEMDKVFPELMRHLKQTGMLWVSWPKAKQLDTDLSLPHVIRIGYSHGLVESICLSVDSTWSGLKFTRPKPGKTYHNSHGQLPASARAAYNSFKPNLLRYTNNVAGKACHVVGYATQVGLTQALGVLKSLGNCWRKA